jgi:hypothetical protein
MSDTLSLVPGAMQRKQSVAMRRRPGTAINSVLSNGPGSAQRHENAAARPGQLNAFTFHMHARYSRRSHLPSPLRVGGEGTMQTKFSPWPPTPTLPRKGGERKN